MFSCLLSHKYAGEGDCNTSSLALSLFPSLSCLVSFPTSSITKLICSHSKSGHVKYDHCDDNGDLSRCVFTANSSSNPPPRCQASRCLAEPRAPPFRPDSHRGQKQAAVGVLAKRAETRLLPPTPRPLPDSWGGRGSTIVTPHFGMVCL